MSSDVTEKQQRSLHEITFSNSGIFSELFLGGDDDDDGDENVEFRKTETYETPSYFFFAEVCDSFTKVRAKLCAG